MNFIYNSGIYLLGFAIRVAAVFNKKARLWINGRKGLFVKLQNQINTANKLVWFHCSSLGEFEQGKPVIEAFKKKHPGFKVLLTFYSPSGYLHIKDSDIADYIYYLPLDTAKNAKRFINIVKPDIVYFVKYEFWYNFLFVLNKKEIPVFLISAIFRNNQIFFKKYGKWYREILSFISLIFVQDLKSEELLNSVGINNVLVSGDTRFDRVTQIALLANKNKIVKNFAAESFLIVAGSTWEPDENILLNYLNETKFDVKFVIAPHEVHSQNLKRIESMFGTNIIRYSQFENKPETKAGVLLIDNIGLLSSIYKYASIAYVGGAFKTGLHNVLEPAAHGKVVLFGPDYSKFREAVGLIEAKAAFSFENFNEFKKIADTLINMPEKCKSASSFAENYVKENCGATALILDKTAVFLI